MLRALPALLGLLTVLSSSAVALAQTSPAVRRVEQLYLESDYDAALQACTAILRNDRSPPGDRQEALKYTGTILFAQGNTGEARNAFVRLLRDDPRYRLPADWPPRVIEFFEQLRAEALPPPRIRHRVPAGFRIGTPIVVSAQLLFLAENHRPRLYYRIQGYTTYSVADMERDREDLYSGIIPASHEMSPDRDTRIEYYIAVEEGQRTVLTEASAEHPHSFVVGRVEGLPPPDGDHRTVRGGGGGGAPWLLIGLSGVAAIGLGVGAYFLLASTATEDTGSVMINIGLPAAGAN